MFAETNQLTGLYRIILYYSHPQPTQVLLCAHTTLSNKSYRAGAQIVLIHAALHPPAVIINEMF